MYMRACMHVSLGVICVGACLISRVFVFVLNFLWRILCSQQQLLWVVSMYVCMCVCVCLCVCVFVCVHQFVACVHACCVCECFLCVRVCVCMRACEHVCV